MKMDNLVSISGSGKDIKRVTGFFLFILFCGCLVLLGSDDLKNHTFDEIYFKFRDRIENSKISKYQPLLHFKSGEPFNFKLVRKSIDNLYKVGAFENIETRAFKKPDQKLDLYFIFSPKYSVSSLKISGITNGSKSPGFKKKELKNALFSVQENTYFEENSVKRVIEEAHKFLNSRGYFNPGITCTLTRNDSKSTVLVKLHVNPGEQAAIQQLDLKVTPTHLSKDLRNYFKGHHYIPYKFNQYVDKAKQFLKKQQYYFPEIKMSEEFSDDSQSKVNLTISVIPGYRYIFKFEGMKERISLISSIWAKKVFEKWAEKESKARILYFLKNKGHLNAAIESKIEVNDVNQTKTITFTVKKNKKYKLGKIHLKGNRSIPDKELRDILKTDDLLFNKFFHLRLKSLLVDREILRLFYYFQGYPNAQVHTQPEFPAKTKSTDQPTKTNDKKKEKVDITFLIEEGKRFTVDSILFEGNTFFTTQTLLSYMRTRANGPFVQQRLSEDIEKINNLYIFYGFTNVEISPEISQGNEKSIMIRIREGKSYRMGNLIVIGASRRQRRLIRRLFPIKKDNPFDRLKLDTFEQEIENSAIFNQFKITKIERPNHIMDVLIKVSAEYSRYYGFGIGWEGRKDARATLEYQGKNVFRSYSTFSAMLQYGTNEIRGLLSYDTPYFFKTRLNSSLKTWFDNEVYSSYEFERYGISESLIKKLSSNSYVLGSLSWYRTKLTKLEITPNGIDQLDDPFDTTAFNLSYVNERRDDPFNPTDGTFFSADLKVGIPILEKDNSFTKFQLSYQNNFSFLKNGIFSFSVRNGLAFGELSITERFFAGGVNSYRGTRKDRLGPIDPLENEPKGGNALLLFNFEATFPLVILPVNDFYYTIFVDIGSLSEKVKEFNFKKLETAIGIGLKYKTRMGPLRFDLAWDVGERFSWKNFKFHIGIGNVF